MDGSTTELDQNVWLAPVNTQQWNNTIYFDNAIIFIKFCMQQLVRKNGL